MLDRRKMITTWVLPDDRAWLESQKKRMGSADPSKPCEILESRGKMALFFKNGFYRANNKKGKYDWVETV